MIDHDYKTQHMRNGVTLGQFQVTTTEAAAILGIHRSNAYKVLVRELTPIVLPGSTTTRLWQRAEVETLAANRLPPGRPPVHRKAQP